MAKRFFAIFCCFCFIILAFANLSGFVDAGQRGVLLFGRNVLPVLFPFFFISGLLVELGFFNAFSKFGKSAPVFVLSLLSGYPTGSRILRDLYNRGEISRNDAIKTATYTSTCSPIFIIATLGICFYGSAKIGVIIFASTVLGAIINGLLYKKTSFKSSQIPLMNEALTRKSYAAKTDDISTIISNSLYSAIQNILAVGGLIIIFFIAVNLIGGGVFLSGLLEMTNGAYLASLFFRNSIIVPCAIVSFGGLCVAMQSFVFMNAFKMPLWFYMLYKTTHTIFAVITCFVLTVLFC